MAVTPDQIQDDEMRRTCAQGRCEMHTNIYMETPKVDLTPETEVDGRYKNGSYGLLVKLWVVLVL
jgi:hypothetical protein